MTKGELGEAGGLGGDCVCRPDFRTQGPLALWRWLISNGFVSDFMVFLFTFWGTLPSCL